MDEGDELEGALAALGGAAFLLPLSFVSLPAILATLIPSAVGGAILGSWKPRYLGPIAFGFGLLACVVALISSSGDLGGFFFWLLLVPLLALPLGASLVPLGLAAPPAPPPPAQLPAWALRPLGPDPGIGPLGSEQPLPIPPRIGASDFQTMERVRAPITDARRGAIAVSLLSSFVTWLGACHLTLTLPAVLLPNRPDAPLGARAEFWSEAGVVMHFIGLPGLVAAATLLAGHNWRRAGFRGAAATVVHTGLGLLYLGLIPSSDEFYILGGVLLYALGSWLWAIAFRMIMWCWSERRVQP